MSERTLNVKVKLRRDIEANFEKVKDTLVLLKGEVVIVETASGLRIKVGDAVKTYAQLPFIDENLIAQINNIVVRGYYYNNKFYANIQHTEAYVGYDNKIYIDNPSHNSYCYDSSEGKYFLLNQIPTATDSQAGITKLYTTLGINTDGAINQKCVTEEIGKKFEVSAGDDETLIFIK